VLFAETQSIFHFLLHKFPAGRIKAMATCRHLDYQADSNSIYAATGPSGCRRQDLEYNIDVSAVSVKS